LIKHSVQILKTAVYSILAPRRTKATENIRTASEGTVKTESHPETGTRFGPG